MAGGAQDQRQGKAVGGVGPGLHLDCDLRLDCDDLNDLDYLDEDHLDCDLRLDCDLYLDRDLDDDDLDLGVMML